MRLMSKITVLVALIVLSCARAEVSVKTAPNYVGVDPKVRTLVDEYFELSTRNHIKFDNVVTVGFSKIDAVTDAVGLCTYGAYFREIDIDPDYWNKLNSLAKKALLFHELTHCYCSRSHDYGNGTQYASTSEERIREVKEWNGGPKIGRYDDACPLSLMYPIAMDSACFLAHYSDYLTEMFNRCAPY